MNNEFIDNFIFETEKDSYFTNINEFYGLLYKKYKIKEKKRDLYVKIKQYQLDFYGETLVDKDYFNTCEDLKRIHHNAKCRHYRKLQYEKGKRKQYE